MHMPQSPVLGVPDGNNQNVVQPSGQVTYRDLMMKIKRYTDAGWITREEVASLVQQAGAPSVQLLGSMAHLVVQVDTLLEAAVYDRQK